MKFGIRTPSIKRSISARTTGKLKRTINRSVNPLYGKKGMGYINDPKRAIYNKIYNKTTIGVNDIVAKNSFKNESSVAMWNDESKQYQVEKSNQTIDKYFANMAKYRYSASLYGGSGVIIKVLSCLLVLMGLFVLPLGLVFIGLGVLFFCIGNKYSKISKIKMLNQTNLYPLPKSYMEENNEEWTTVFCDDVVTLILEHCKCNDLKVNQMVNLEITAPQFSENNNFQIQIQVNGLQIGYIESPEHRQIIRACMQDANALIKAQISYLSPEKVYLRVYCYKSKNAIEKDEAEERENFEREKKAYIRMAPVTYEEKLVYNKNSEMQDDLICVKTGEAVELCEENGRLLVVAKEVLYLGYLPQKTAETILELIDKGYSITDSNISHLSSNGGVFDAVVKVELKDINYL